MAVLRRQVIRGVWSTLVSVVVVTAPAGAQEHERGFTNLKVLPSDITREELNEAMLGNLLGLGLRRLQGEGCLHCHVGNMEQPRATWDYASDDKLAKRKARVMMAMVRDINEHHLASLEVRGEPPLRVTCYTCHAGRVDPRPLPVILWSAYQAGGIDSVETRYRALQAEYHDGDAYDFRTNVLVEVAARMADLGAVDDAVAVTALNVESYPDDPRAQRGWLEFVLERTLSTDGVPAALAELDSLEGTLPSGVVTVSVLDALGWRLRRTDRVTAGNAVLEGNLRKFPHEYIPNESMAFVLFDAGERDAAFHILERWLQEHPDHERARRLLTNLRARSE
jgi:Photosynthetic reaction centre cytochrome C subunit